MKKIIWVKTKYVNYYNLLSKLNYINLMIFDIKKNNNYVYLKINKEDFAKLSKYIKSYKFIIHSYTGLFSLINIVRSKFLYFIITIVGLLLFWILNNIIVDVEVLHQNSHLKEVLEYELIRLDVKPLTFKKDYDTLLQIKNEILDKYKDQIDWIEIEIVGMKYVIKLEERIINSEESKNDLCHVYALEDGLITDLKVTKGVANVSIGDYVKKGDLLINGNVLLNDEVISSVCAEGEVYAQTWYDVNVSIPYLYYENIKTGTMRYNLSIEHDNKETKILNDRIDYYESEKIVLFDLFGYKLFLEKQYEIEKIEKKYTEEEIVNEALNLAEEKVLLKFSTKDSILSKNVLKKTQNNSTIDIDIFIVAKKLIS